MLTVTAVFYFPPLSPQLDEVEKRFAVVAAEQMSMEQQLAVDVPHVKHSISLYANVSGIRWDYESPAIEGVISLEGKEEDSATFKLDPKINSEYFTANYLWDLIAARHNA